MSNLHLLKRSRIIIYLLCFVLILHVLFSFTKQSSTTVMTRNLPWYTSSHPSLTSFNNHHVQSHLSPQERQQLQADMIEKAREQAYNEFPATKGIIGSTQNTERKASEFRKRVECWTTGEWVQVESPAYIMPHFQDPIYSSCDKKYRRKNPDGSLRPAVKYVWQSKCDPKVDIDAVSWCQALNGRSLLLVGDLVQYQLHEVFLDTLRDGPTVCFGELNCKGKS